MGRTEIFVLFYNRDASKLFVAVQADPSSGLLNDFGVFVLDAAEIEKQKELLPLPAVSRCTHCDAISFTNSSG